MCVAKRVRETDIRVRTSRWGTPLASGPVMYKLGLKPPPQVPPWMMVSKCAKRRIEGGRTSVTENPQNGTSARLSPCRQFVEALSVVPIHLILACRGTGQMKMTVKRARNLERPFLGCRASRLALV